MSYPVFVKNMSYPVFVKNMSYPVFVKNMSYPVFVKNMSYPVFVKNMSYPVFVKNMSYPVFVKNMSYPVFVKNMSYPVFVKKSLKISESVNQRRTDNTMAKRKSTKEQKTIYKTHTHKTKDRVTRTPLRTGGELRCSRRKLCSCSTSDTRRINLVTNPVISRGLRKDREVLTTSGILCHIYSMAVNQVVVATVKHSK